MLAAQASRAARLAVADDVIVNDGPARRSAPQVAALHQKYLTLAASARAPEPPTGVALRRFSAAVAAGSGVYGARAAQAQ